MKIRARFPHPVRFVPTAWIPMPDGARLAASLWLPEVAEPVPAILEYVPYRRRDVTAARDALTHPWFAGHGYACVRVDLRGSGDSDGVLRDEYLEQELADGEAVLRWLAAQPWCNGRVGMLGISWGGFNGLQLAARRPPELHAIITVASTDDRYTDDVHYMGGCLLGDNLSWASTMFAYNAAPPDPKVVGDRWRAMWEERLEGSGLWIEKWLRHQRRDAYWRRGSVCEDYDAIQCPVMAVSGWADGYSNAVLRLVQHLKGPRMGLVGPWGHRYPHLGVPGPAIGFLQEALRWWDQWLKGIETGITAEPRLRVWMRESVPPTTYLAESPGRWVGEPSWPSPNITWVRRPLDAGRICEPGEAVADRPVPIQSPLSVGLFAGRWCSFSATPDLPHDQREEDGGALVFDTPPLAETLEILGPPTAALELSADRPVAMVAVRLSDVAPDDRATRVTYGLFNLAHRDGHGRPAPLEPGRRHRIRVEMNDVGQVFPRGHRLRLSISTSYWPVAWPPPAPVRLTVHTAASALLLPVRPPRGEALRPFAPPETAPPLPVRAITPREDEWLVLRDLPRDRSTLKVVKDEGRKVIEPIDLTVHRRTVEWYTYQEDDPTSARGEVRAEWCFERGAWLVRTRTRTLLTCTASDFEIRAELDAWEGEERAACKSWRRRIPRDLM